MKGSNLLSCDRILTTHLDEGNAEQLDGLGVGRALLIIGDSEVVTVRLVA